MPYTLPGSIEYRVTNGCRYTVHSTLANPVRPKLADVWIRNPKTLDCDLRRIGAAGDMVVRGVSPSGAAVVGVEQCLFRKDGSKCKVGTTRQ